MTVKTRDCMKCGAGFFDDGNTWCPRCDAACWDRQPGVLPGAGKRVMEMREKEQAELRERFEACLSG